MPEGKYFILVSKLGGCALGFDGGSSNHRLITVQRNDEDDHQQWYIDRLSGTIRNKSNQLCIHASEDGNAVLKQFESGNGSQQFALDGNFVKNRDGRVLDITGDDPKAGVPICVWEQHGETNQQFDIVHTKPRYFILKGEQSGRAIDIVEENTDPGAKICIYDVQKSDNQLWYEDGNGLIRSKLNNFVFDDSAGDICMQPSDANNPHRSWVINGASIVKLSNPKTVLDVSCELCDNGSAICSYENNDAPNQRWSIEYV